MTMTPKTIARVTDPQAFVLRLVGLVRIFNADCLGRSARDRVGSLTSRGCRSVCELAGSRRLDPLLCAGALLFEPFRVHPAAEFGDPQAVGLDGGDAGV